MQKLYIFYFSYFITSVANNFIEFKPTASNEFQMISKHDFTIYDLKSSQSKIT